MQKALIKAKIPFESNVFIERYEVDFLVEPFVVIEVDGYMYYIRDVINKDKRKTLDLEHAGYRVLRFTGDDVMYDTKNCIRRIYTVRGSVWS